MRKLIAAAAILCAALAAGLTSAQEAPNGRPPAAQQGGGGTETGFAVFQTRCMSCHGNPAVSQAPQPSAIRQMSPERIYQALTTGPMRAQGASLSDDQKKMLAAFMSGRPLGSTQSGDYSAMQGHCPSNPAIVQANRAADWDGWSPTVDNARFQSRAGLTAADVPRLKLKWAFGTPDGLSAYGQPAATVGWP